MASGMYIMARRVSGFAPGIARHSHISGERKINVLEGLRPSGEICGAGENRPSGLGSVADSRVVS